MTSEVWDPKNCRKTAKVENFVMSLWNRWVATDVHLDQSSLLRKQWSPLCLISRGEGEEVGEVAFLGLWKVVENLMFEGLDLFNQSGYMR
jgi:hypothetical protein